MSYLMYFVMVVIFFQIAMLFKLKELDNRMKFIDKVLKVIKK